MMIWVFITNVVLPMLCFIFDISPPALRFSQKQQDYCSTKAKKYKNIGAGSGGAAAPPGDILAPPGQLLPPSDFYPVPLLLENADFRVKKTLQFRWRPFFLENAGFWVKKTLHFR